MRFIIWAAALLTATGASYAQDLDWGFIGTLGSPDNVSVFDLDNPTDSLQILGSVDGNFNRSMDFVSADLFYYFVSTDSLNDKGDRGLWRWENGVNTQIATIPFQNGEDGGGTLSADHGTFYITIDDGDDTAGQSLYAFENLDGTPTFTEVGETGLVRITGLAAHPVTGQLVAYESSTQALYEISTADGSAILIGASGQAAEGIGGMDWSADGSTLLLVDRRDLFLVDPANGTLTPAGSFEESDVGSISALSFRPGADRIFASRFESVNRETRGTR